MSTRHIQNPKGAKTFILSFKTAAGVALVISRQNLKLICFADVTIGKLRIDADAIVWGKQDGNAYGKRMVLIYKTNMHMGSIMNPEQCPTKVKRNAKKR